MPTETDRTETVFVPVSRNCKVRLPAADGKQFNICIIQCQSESVEVDTKELSFPVAHFNSLVLLHLQKNGFSLLSVVTVSTSSLSEFRE